MQTAVHHTLRVVLVFALAHADTSLAGELTGNVVRVTDGDTITVLDASQQQHKIRLSGIDAPEIKQAFGRVSKMNLADLVAGKQVTVEWQKRDRYRRIVGKVLVDGRDVNLQQVQAGLAWHFKKYEKEQWEFDRTLYAASEDKARRAHRGLWADPHAVSPSQFRHGVHSAERLEYGPRTGGRRD